VPSVYLDYGFDKEDKLIAISFDDGPYTKNTLAIMDILDKYEAKATFFLLGSRVKGQEDTVRALVDRGHQIASHSLSHPDFTRLSNKEIIAQLNATEEAIAKATHHQEKLFVRPPYGALRKDQMEKLDYVFVNWSVDTEDWRHRDAKRVCDISLKYAYDGSILLMHELYDSTVDSLDCILKTLDEQGYQFVTIKELFEAKELDYKHGHLYYDGI
ncbi:MAG TPA: polysaccharide deacetylase family protein, partial [Erysipelothrix sp.]|nr:polysaccharide deacetylase family protein [Erysipelothrix sp.]